MKNLINENLHAKYYRELTVLDMGDESSKYVMDVELAVQRELAYRRKIFLSQLQTDGDFKRDPVPLEMSVHVIFLMCIIWMTAKMVNCKLNSYFSITLNIMFLLVAIEYIEKKCMWLVKPFSIGFIF